MAEATAQERLLPSLLDRLVDEDPQTRVESREKRVLSMRQYQRAVLRDLSWLLNSSAKAEREEIEEFPEAAKSVLNYGMPDLTGSTSSAQTPAQVERMVRNAIGMFEPRIPKNALQVKVVENAGAPGNVVQIEIRGEVWAVPMPESLFVKTEVDLETGMATLRDQLHG